MTGADLELTAGGRRLRFPAVWLRDNCPCAECQDPGSGQKLKDITDIPNDLGVAASADAGESVEPRYLGLLSRESVRTLAVQGGPMTDRQAAAFEALAFARDAVAVRRWDDEAKDPAVTPPAFAHFEPLLGGLVRS